MIGSTRLGLLPDHKRQVLTVLAAHLPPNAKVWIFGSRATGRARRYSDLDLAIDAGRRLTLDEIARLAEAFRESDLLYKVDLVGWQAIDDRFRRSFAGARLQLDGATPVVPLPPACGRE